VKTPFNQNKSIKKKKGKEIRRGKKRRPIFTEETVLLFQLPSRLGGGGEEKCRPAMNKGGVEKEEVEGSLSAINLA